LHGSGTRQCVEWIAWTPPGYPSAFLTRKQKHIKCCDAIQPASTSGNRDSSVVWARRPGKIPGSRRLSVNIGVFWSATPRRL